MGQPETPYQNPLKDEGHVLHGRYVAARKALSGGRPDMALSLWKDLRDSCQPDTAEYVESDRQVAVCLRLIGNTKARGHFDRVRQAASEIHSTLEVAVICDFSAWMLEESKYDEAIRTLEGMAYRLAPSVDLWCIYTYLGRAYGRQPGGRSNATYYLVKGLNGLRGHPEYADQYLDTLLWLVEIRRMRYILPALSVACQRRQWLRAVVDLPVTAIGGYRGRTLVRRFLMKLTAQ